MDWATLTPKMRAERMAEGISLAAWWPVIVEEAAARWRYANTGTHDIKGSETSELLGLAAETAWAVATGQRVKLCSPRGVGGDGGQDFRGVDVKASEFRGRHNALPHLCLPPDNINPWLLYALIAVDIANYRARLVGQIHGSRVAAGLRLGKLSPLTCSECGLGFDYDVPIHHTLLRLRGVEWRGTCVRVPLALTTPEEWESIRRREKGR